MTDLPSRLAADVPTSWPASVRALVAGWHAELAAAAHADGATVLELAGSEAHALVELLGRGGEDDRAGTYDSVVSAGGLIHHADLAVAVRGVRALLRADGVFRFAEPVEVPGWRGLALASLTSRTRVTRGLHLSRDVPAVLRAEGLLITDLSRRRIDTAQWPLRRWAVGRAHIHHTQPDPDLGGTS